MTSPATIESLLTEKDVILGIVEPPPPPQETKNKIHKICNRRSRFIFNLSIMKFVSLIHFYIKLIIDLDTLLSDNQKATLSQYDDQFASVLLKGNLLA